MVALLRLRRSASPLLLHFAVQSVAWGAVDLAIVLWARTRVHERSLEEVVALDRFLWLNVGLDAGYAGIGATLALVGWFGGRRLGLVGAGLGVIVQGLALLVLDLQLASVIVR